MESWQEFVTAFSLFREPIAAGAAAGAGLGVLSVFIVLRRVVFLSATLAQSAGLGVTLAFFLHAHADLHLPPTIGAILTSLFVVGLLSVNHTRLGTTREALLGLLFLGSSAGAILIGGYISQESHDIQTVLFGSAVLVRTLDMWLLIAGAVAVIVLTAWFWRGFLFAAFDEEGARVQGLPSALLIGLMLGMIIAMNALATRALGSLPVFALATLPAVAALSLTRSLPITVCVAALIGVIGGAGGYVVAFFANWPVGASQSGVLVLISALGLTFRRLRG